MTAAEILGVWQHPLLEASVSDEAEMLTANEARLPAIGRRRAMPKHVPWIEVLLLVAAASAITRLINRFLMQLFYVRSESMLPTIRVNDLLVVSRVSLQMGPPQRGAIVVFKSPFHHATEGMNIPAPVVRHLREVPGMEIPPAIDFIKRVVAVEGDLIEICNDRMVLNGEVVDESYMPEGIHMTDLTAMTIPGAHVFVMGDNRERSSDSRTFGPIPEENILGKVVLRLWPISRFGSVNSAGRSIRSAPVFKDRTLRSPAPRSRA